MSLSKYAAVAILALAPTLVTAEGWPKQPIKMIVPFAPGGGVDFMGRIAAKQLSDRLGQKVYIENQPGANGAIGANALMRSAPDGYTVAAISDGPIVTNPGLYKNLTYQPLRDFVPVAMMARFPSILVMHPSVPAHNIKELIALAKAKPGALNYGTAGIGNFSHLGMELLAYQTGIKLVHVPYKGSGPAMAALLAGDVQLQYVSVATAISYIRAGKIIALGVGDAQRLPGLPDIPTIADTVKGYDFSGWVGLFAPVKTPPDIIEHLSRETAAMLKEPEVLKIFADQSVVAWYQQPQEFAEFIAREQRKWAEVIKNQGIQAE